MKEDSEKRMKKQLLYLRITTTAVSVIAVAILAALLMTVPRLTAVLKSTDRLLQKSNAIMEEIDTESIDGLNDTVQTLNKAVEPLQELVGFVGDITKTED